MSANDKPSEMAAMYLLTCKEFWQTIISITKKAGRDHAIESNTLHAFIAFSIDRVTGCDSLAEENQRLRGVLGEITQFPDGNLSPAARAMREIAVEALKK